MARVVVVGGSNVDVLARTTAAAVPATSNPGRVTVTPGGVGRNIAENLARLGTTCHLVSAVGHDPQGDLLLDQTAAAGVDVEHVRAVDAPTGSYVALLDHDGELAWAVSDMAGTASLGPGDVADAAPLVVGADLLVLDGNLSAETLVAAWDLAVGVGTPVVLDPVSVPKSAALAGLLAPSRPLMLLSAGHQELDMLTARAGAGALHATGVELVWERTGPTGSVLHRAGGHDRLASYAAEVVDVTGAGDAMLAAFCHALLGGAAPVEAAAYGHAAAALTVASRHTVRPDLTDDLVRSVVAG